ncbi:Gfo/Idh/MocA family oxidoreductase [Microbispora sp. NPDC088329]|uniref:Gfo/Idh/MocA family protein n=1 Tax=Microbispora sp. NPDC088329 TaxID=3154869 RepID=UPI0034377172
MTGPIRVGVVGASPSRGWAATAHLPALARLPGFTLAAVATSNPASAREAARVYDARHALTAAELVAHPDVDLVVVAVKVPGHAELIRAALGAGKHVLSEWPLGTGLGEATELAALAKRAGVVHAVGLQGLHSPGARHVRELLDGGRIGEVWAVSVVFSAAGGLGSGRIPRSAVWAADPAAGVSLLSVSAAHILSVLATAVGEPSELSAIAACAGGTAVVEETGETIPVGMVNQVVLHGFLGPHGFLGQHGRLDGGVVASVAVQGGTPPAAAGFLMRIAGSEGAMTVTPVQRGGSMQIADWAVRVARHDGAEEEVPVPSRLRAAPPDVPAGPPANVAALYLEVGRAIAEGRDAHPSFETAVRYHRLVRLIEEASRSGLRLPADRP